MYFRAIGLDAYNGSCPPPPPPLVNRPEHRLEDRVLPRRDGCACCVQGRIVGQRRSPAALEPPGYVETAGGYLRL